VAIDSILDKLFAKKIVTSQQKKDIERTERNDGKGMNLLLDLVLDSLKQNFPDKYIGFFETLESHEDPLLRDKANGLGKQKE